jgi:hypothetical protein
MREIRKYARNQNTMNGSDFSNPIRTWLKASFPLIFEAASRVRHADTTRALFALPRYPFNLAKQGVNGRYFAVDICGSMGMGALLTHTVKLLKYADDNGLHPVIAYTNPLYATTFRSDWFDDYFEFNTDWRVDQKTKLQLSYLKLYNEHSLCGISLPNRMELSEARRLFFKYITIKPIIHDLVEDFSRRMNGNVYDVSIHYRGTDKKREAISASHEDIVSKLESATRNGLSIQSAFLATDEQSFGDYIRRRFPTIQFYSFDLGQKDTGRKPRHFSTMSGRDKAIEALVNILEISKSAVCIRTCSHLSAWSKILNPNLKTHTVNRLKRHIGSFPEREILEAESLSLGS